MAICAAGTEFLPQQASQMIAVKEDGPARDPIGHGISDHDFDRLTNHLRCNLIQLCYFA